MSDEREESTVGIYRCPGCDKSFKNYDEMDEHRALCPLTGVR